jgi:membrane-associated protease RseP (regulator of RpoE activity)
MSTDADAPIPLPWTAPAERPAPARIRAERQFPRANVFLFVATVITTTLLHGPAFSATLIAILLAHESGHYLMCPRHGVSASLPYFLPAPLGPGTFGAFIRIRSRFPDRRALFDIGAAGPWAGFVVAVVAVGVGLRFSTTTAMPPPGPAWEFGDSLLTAWLTRLVIGPDPVQTVMLHPVATAGWFGLLVTSINLLPVGQLDGGHVLYAALPRRLRVFPALLIAGLVWLGLRGAINWLVWAAIMFAMAVIGPPPVENRALPLGAGRLVAVVLSFVLLVLTFVPDPIRFVP